MTQKELCRCGLNVSILMTLYERAKEDMKDVWAKDNVRRLDSIIGSVEEACNVNLSDARGHIDRALSFMEEEEWLKARRAINDSRDTVVGAFSHCAHNQPTIIIEKD